MRRHEVRNQVLFLAQIGVNARIAVAETLVHGIVRFAHDRKHRIGYVLGRHFELAAHMMLAQLANECVVGIGKRVIEPNA